MSGSMAEAVYFRRSWDLQQQQQQGLQTVSSSSAGGAVIGGNRQAFMPSNKSGLEKRTATPMRC